VKYGSLGRSEKLGNREFSRRELFMKRAKSGNGKFILLDPSFGISGDMFAAAMISIGAGDDDFFKALKGFRIEENYDIKTTVVERCGLKADSFNVEVKQRCHEHHHGRSLEEIIDIVSSNRYLSGTVRKRAIKMFERLAEAEAKVHFRKEKIHFHEVGALDSIIDICAAVLALETLGVEKVIYSALNVGYGTVKTSHGQLPVPCPATAELLKGIPVFFDGNLPPYEATTPTGALIISELCEFRKLSGQFSILKTGYGAGSKSFPSFPNVLKACICSRQAVEDSDGEVAVIETMIDDASGEEMAFLAEKIISLGALDCSIIPAFGKKGRPANLLLIICERELLNEIIETVLSDSSSNGVRYRMEKRRILPREIAEIETPFGKLAAKFAISGGKITKVKAEHDSILKLARSSDMSYICVKKGVEAFLNKKYLGKKK